MTDALIQLSFSLSLVAPIFFIMALGYVFKRIDLINNSFIEVASRLVFQVALPAMLFLNIATADHNFSKATSFLTFSVSASVIFFVFSSVTAKLVFKHSPDNGVLVQGSFRANTAIIGLAYVQEAFDTEGIALAALYVAVTTVVYNIQAVICLSPKNSTSSVSSAKVMLLTLTKNPLIIAISLGVVASVASIPIPGVIVDTGNYLSKMTLPLALLCTGGSLDFRRMKEEIAPTWFATSYKLLLAPLTITLGGYLFGFRGVELGILFFMNAAPVAAASYAMTRAFGGNATLSANIIGLTTLFSSITVCLGFLILKILDLL